MEPALHADCEPLAFLLGTWRGEGEGEWPRGEPFRYGEEMTFTRRRRLSDVLAAGWMLPDGAPVHFGALLPSGRAGRVELVLAHPLGVAEVAR
jgi:hypothetical protein